jgi:hypothetical protein
MGLVRPAGVVRDGSRDSAALGEHGPYGERGSTGSGALRGAGLYRERRVRRRMVTGMAASSASTSSLYWQPMSVST